VWFHVQITNKTEFSNISNSNDQMAHCLLIFRFLFWFVFISNVISLCS
jgi:hypothetical protein